MDIANFNVNSAQFSERIGSHIDPSMAWNYRIFPSVVDEETLFLTDQFPTRELMSELEFLLEFEVKLVQIETQQLERLLSQHYRKPNEKQAGNSLKDLTEVDFIENVVEESIQLGASDIHLEPGDKECRIRYRVDGKLLPKYTIGSKEYKGIVNRVKVRAGLDIAEKRLPQDGRIQLKVMDESVDIRVNSLPTLYGEKIVLRILLQSLDRLNINRLGMTTEQEKLFVSALKQQSGIILISGPTGSGKTTTLYSALRLMNAVSQNICTVEDPIEYRLEGINQVQVKESIGLSFSETLRALLRQDPDIIMIGEIRDLKTAQMAIRASLTGHLVLSTIHTNSALDTINRLIDMGVPKFLLAPTIKLSIAQRLIRKLCEHCKQPNPGSPTSGQSLNAEGCDQCYYTGFKGRVAVYEMIPSNKSFREWVSHEANPDQFPTKVDRLSDRAIELVKSGITTMDEVYSLLD